MIYPVTMADLIVEQDPDPEASLNGESPGAERRRLLTKKSEGKPSPVKAVSLSLVGHLRRSL